MITLDSLSYRYPSGTVALTNLNAQIGPGVHLLVGENGSGKTTLLHLIAGLRTAIPAGACMVDDCPSSFRLPEMLQNVFILTDEMKFPYKSINEMVRRHAPFYPSFSEEVLRNALQRFNMSGDEPIDRFSLGNRKKAQLAYAIALQPNVLLLDEPLNGLDITAREEFIRLLAENTSENQTVIVSSHTVFDFRNLIDGVIVISAGRLLLSMSTWDIARKLKFITATNPPADALYIRQSFGTFNAIVPNTDGDTTDIDLILLYSAILSDARQNILSLL